jgi:hypothetical protein
MLGHQAKKNFPAMLYNWQKFCKLYECNPCRPIEASVALLISYAVSFEVDPSTLIEDLAPHLIDFRPVAWQSITQSALVQRKTRGATDLLSRSATPPPPKLVE